MDKVQCICCSNWLSVEFCDGDPLVITPVYDGLIFRSTGNFGSSVFDPITQEDILQIIVCDDCIKSKAKRVKHFFNLKTIHLADYCELKPNE